MSYKRFITRGLVALMLGLGSGAHSKIPEQNPLPPLGTLSEMESKAIASCESLSVEERLRYVFSKLLEYGGKDAGMPAVSPDKSYFDDGTDCQAHSDEINQNQMIVRAWRSNPGKICKVDGQMNLTYTTESGIGMTLMVPDVKKGISDNKFLLTPPLPPRGYAGVVAAQDCDVVLSVGRCEELQRHLFDQLSMGFCEQYKFRDMEKGK